MSDITTVGLDLAKNVRSGSVDLNRFRLGYAAAASGIDWLK